MNKSFAGENIEKCQETSPSRDSQKNSLLMKPAQTSKTVEYSETRTEGANTLNTSQLETLQMFLKWI